MDSKRRVETDDIVIHEMENDFHWVKIKSSILTEVTFTEMLASHLKLSEGNKVWVLADVANMKVVTRNAMMFARDNGNKFSLGMAILAPNKGAQTIGDFFINVVRPSYRIKIFNTELNATTWINEQRSLALQ